MSDGNTVIHIARSTKLTVLRCHVFILCASGNVGDGITIGHRADSAPDVATWEVTLSVGKVLPRSRWAATGITVRSL